jgi:serine/threonine protein phosphatase PrpC
MNPMQVGTMLKAAGDSHPGLQRAVNEDRFHLDPVRGLFVVIDGVGGQAAGEKAAETALAMVRTRLERETGAVEDRVREAITLANNEIHRLASIRPEWQGMACVLTIAVVTNGEIVVGHVGDTRLYKLRAGRIDKLTHDHSPVGEREDAGELSERDAMQHPRRNEVYRDVGSERHEPDDPRFIDVFRHPIEPDAAVLLCSDGLTDAVPSAAILQLVVDFAGHPFEIVRGLIDAANAAGGKDNVTVVYAEGPRFAMGEDTRDLRAHRVAPATPVRVEGPAAGAGVDTVVVDTPWARWRVGALVLLLLTAAGLGLYWQRARLPWSDWPRIAALRDRLTAGTGTVAPVTHVKPGESIDSAIARAVAGGEVLVEPGEYREQIRLKTGVRVVSRVPRGASVRLPGGASERDAAVTAFEVNGAVFSGFRIVGDAATPLGIGVVVRNSHVELSDIEVTGAHFAAIEYVGADGGALLASHLRDNPGAALVVGGAASPRIAHNAFARNATSERAAGPLLVEATARPVVTANTFLGLRPESLIVPPAIGRAALERDNWFISTPEREPAAPVRPGRSGRARR